jgi:hypothetical protein
MAHVNGTHNDDILNGTGGDDTLNGRAGDDTLFGRGGDDVLSGGAGNDHLFGGPGDDRLSGRAGDDYLSGGSGDDRLSGGAGDDELHGGAGDDQLSGGAGDDQLFGGSGDDVLQGGAGDDHLSGGTGDDVLSGGPGDDVLNGGAGDDILTGGPGHDTFVFNGDFGSDTITDLGKGDVIDLTAFSDITHLSDLDISEVNGDTVITVGPDGGSITVTGMTPAEVLSHIEVACVMRGTKVKTPDGEVAVEQLGIGDRVITIDGSVEEIKWIGRRAYSRPFLMHRGHIAPVKFAAGSLGPDMPAAPLYVSPEHAMYVDNVLVPARLLENGTTIRQINDFDVVEYFHLEFDEPQVIFTNGAPSESYVDSGNRRMFANYADYVAQHGRSLGDGTGRRRFYLVCSGDALDAIRARLAAESAAAG